MSEFDDLTEVFSAENWKNYIEKNPTLTHDELNEKYKNELKEKYWEAPIVTKHSNRILNKSVTKISALTDLESVNCKKVFSCKLLHLVEQETLQDASNIVEKVDFFKFKKLFVFVIEVTDKITIDDLQSFLQLNFSWLPYNQPLIFEIKSQDKLHYLYKSQNNASLVYCTLNLFEKSLMFKELVKHLKRYPFSIDLLLNIMNNFGISLLESDISKIIEELFLTNYNSTEKILQYAIRSNDNLLMKLILLFDCHLSSIPNESGKVYDDNIISNEIIDEALKCNNITALITIIDLPFDKEIMNPFRTIILYGPNGLEAIIAKAAKLSSSAIIKFLFVKIGELAPSQENFIFFLMLHNDDLEHNLLHISAKNENESAFPYLYETFKACYRLKNEFRDLLLRNKSIYKIFSIGTTQNVKYFSNELQKIFSVNELIEIFNAKEMFHLSRKFPDKFTTILRFIRENAMEEEDEMREEEYEVDFQGTKLFLSDLIPQNRDEYKQIKLYIKCNKNSNEKLMIGEMLKEVPEDFIERKFYDANDSLKKTISIDDFAKNLSSLKKVTIFGDFGCGKTATLNYLSFKAKEIHENYWIVVINSTKMRNLFDDEINSRNCVEKLMKVLYLTEIERIIFNFMYNKNRIIIFWDISSENHENVRKIINGDLFYSISSHCLTITKSFNENQIEKFYEFKNGFTLVPFTKDECFNFLINFLSDTLTQERLDKIQKITAFISQTNADCDSFIRFISKSPLILKLIANDIISSTKMHFNLFAVYTKYTEYQLKKSESSFINIEHQRIALTSFFGPELINFTNLNILRKKSKISHQKIIDFGLVEFEESLKIKDKSLMSFYVAQYLIENVINVDDYPRDEEITLRLEVLLKIAKNLVSNKIIRTFIIDYTDRCEEFTNNNKNFSKFAREMLKNLPIYIQSSKDKNEFLYLILNNVELSVMQENDCKKRKLFDLQEIIQSNRKYDDDSLHSYDENAIYQWKYLKTCEKAEILKSFVNFQGRYVTVRQLCNENYSIMDYFSPKTIQTLFTRELISIGETIVTKSNYFHVIKFKPIKCSDLNAKKPKKVDKCNVRSSKSFDLLESYNKMALIESQIELKTFEDLHEEAEIKKAVLLYDNPKNSKTSFFEHLALHYQQKITKPMKWVSYINSKACNINDDGNKRIMFKSKNEKVKDILVKILNINDDITKRIFSEYFDNDDVILFWNQNDKNTFTHRVISNIKNLTKNQQWIIADEQNSRVLAYNLQIEAYEIVPSYRNETKNDFTDYFSNMHNADVQPSTKNFKILKQITKYNKDQGVFKLPPKVYEKSYI